MNKKEQEDAKSKMKSIRSFFMSLTDDPKLRKKEDEDGVKLPDVQRSVTVVKGDQRGTDDVDGVVQGGRGETVVVCAGESMDRSLDKVSATKHLFNCFDTQNVWGDVPYVRGEKDDESGQDNLLVLSDRQTDGAGGGGQGDGGEDGIMYSTVQYVHRVGDEKGETGERWSMKSGKLSRDLGQLDQKQTAGAVSDVGMFQNNGKTLQSRILMWEGAIQSEIVADDSTDCDQHCRPHVMTGNEQHRRSRPV